MQKFTAPLDKANFALKPLQNDARRQLLDLLDTVRGKKALVLEPHFVQPLGFIVDALTLKEHGVEMFCVLESQSGIISALIDRGVRHLVYLLHSRIEAVQAAVAHIAMCRDLGAKFDYTTLLMPRKMKTCELLLENAGILADVSVRGCPLNWVPLEEDILSLEAPAAFKELVVDGDTSCLWDIAHALTALQSSHGAIKHIKGKGIWAAKVQKIMSRMRKELGMAAPVPGSRASDGGIDTLIILDRSVDMVTPMCTQLTYEGLLDEILGLNYGQIRSTIDQSTGGGGAGASPSAASSSSTAAHGGDRKVSGLTSADPVFHATRDLFYVGARKWLNETLRSIQQFKEVGMAGADISQLKGFVAELKEKFARIPLHTSLTEQLGDALRAPSFAARQRIEAALLDEHDDFAMMEDVIAHGENLLPLLRLLCLYCTIHGGIPKKHWDMLRRDLVNTYGHQQLVTLRVLAKAGLLQRREGKRSGSFSAAKPAFKLLMQEGETVDEEDPKDIHFTYAGYAPLSVRLVQQALMPGGWTGAATASAAVETAMAALPGPQFELLQTVDDKGRPIEKRERSTSIVNGSGASNGNPSGSSGAAVKKKRVVMVVFIGGVTLAEISALRFLSRKEMVDSMYGQGEVSQDDSGRTWDLVLLMMSIAILALYHIWYYSWRFSNLIEARGYHRVDLTGQRAREIFVRSIITVPGNVPGNADSATNIALQAARNPITAVSILATGTTVGATTLVGILLDSEKMDQVRALGAADPLTGTSTLFSPEAKLAAAVGMLFLSFFSLAQSLRLFIHFSFFVRAARFCADNPDYYGEGTTEGMFNDSCQSCLRAQTFMSLGFRFLYCWIPLIFWLLGGTFLFSATLVTTIALYNLDQI